MVHYRVALYINYEQREDKDYEKQYNIKQFVWLTLNYK